ncbi:MAG: hypothetical protein WC889_06535 [Myxococcota bacterium]
MDCIKAFWTQPSWKYRNSQIAFFILALQFIIPAFSYTFTPHVAIDQFLQVNKILGGITYAEQAAENASFVWCYLGAANVMTLGFMCALLFFNLRKFYIVVVPLTFMKAYVATMWLVGWTMHTGYMFFLSAAILDYVTSAAFLYFSISAHNDIKDRPDSELVPVPGWKKG